MDVEPEQTSTTARLQPVDVFGTVEPNSKSGAALGYIREAVEASPPSSPVFAPLPRRTSSRRTQSVDLSSRQPAVPSPLGPVRRKRGEREREAGQERRREKDTLRAELDASAAVAPGLALDPRIASDVLALERRFAAASRGKSPSSRPPRSHAHRPRHSLPVTPNRNDLLSTPNRVGSVEPLAPLPESSTGDEPSTTVGPALPSSAVASRPASSPSPEPATPRSGPSPIRIEKPAYASLLPSSDLEPASSGTDAVKRSKRASLTAMFGMTRKKDKEAHTHEKEADSDLLRIPSPPRPVPLRADTHRTSNTMLTAHTSATAGSDDHAYPHGHSPGGSPVNHSPAAIEPSAKTLARAAATRDQLAKRYAILYAGLGGNAADTGSTISASLSSNSHRSSNKFVRGPGANLLDVIRWRSSKPKIEMETERTDEVWEREVERRIRDYPPPHQPMLGDSLPEATSLSWLPYLEPVFAEERVGGPGEHVNVGPGANGKKHMTAWYVLASFVEDYVSSARQIEPHPGGPSPPRKPMDTSPTPSHTKVTSDVRAQALVNAARSAGYDVNVNEGTKFGIIDRALRTRSRQSSVGLEPGTVPNVAGNGARPRNSSVGFVGSASLGGGSMGTISEPPSPSHMQLSNSNSKFLTPSPSVDVNTPASRSRSGSTKVNPNFSHSRSQSQARSLSGGGNGSVDWGRMGALGEGKSMSPASSKMNLANFIMGGAAVLGLNMRRRPVPGSGRDVVSGSENESARISSDASPNPSDVEARYGYGRGGVSDGEGGRVKRRKRTWREDAERVPLSDGAGSGSNDRGHLKRRSWRQSTVVMVPVEVQPEMEREEREKSSQEAREREKEYARKRIVVDDTHDVLLLVNERLRNFVDLASYLNSVHHEGSDVFGDMFMAIPPDVVSALAPDPTEEDGSYSRTPTSTSPLTLDQPPPPSSEVLSSFARHLEGEEKPIAVDMIGRSTLDANLPIRAFDVLHTLDHRLKDISNRIKSLREICDDAEQERKEVKRFYEITAESVETTYPECSQIERLLGSLVTEDMPWLPSWLPLWVRHLLEMFSNQIQFLVENGLRIYGYTYHIISIIVFLISFVFQVMLIFARFIRSIWWVLAVAAISGVIYLMMQPPEGMANFVDVFDS
ncbi:transmembrane protein [Ceratobasidium sp. AG-Ba]|nr:transmembrane protein [Ceratobasidium sp. AG-Ba]